MALQDWTELHTMAASTCDVFMSMDDEDQSPSSSEFEHCIQQHLDSRADINIGDKWVGILQYPFRLDLLCEVLLNQTPCFSVQNHTLATDNEAHLAHAICKHFSQSANLHSPIEFVHICQWQQESQFS